MPTTHPPRAVRALCFLLLGLVALVVVGAGAWPGSSFPGFFVMPNRVVASAGLPGWAGASDGRPVYQQVLTAVDGQRVENGADAYARAVLHRAGEQVVYDFVRDEGVERRTFSLRAFGNGELVAIFGAYLLGGLAYLALAFAASARWRDDERYVALTALGCTGAAFCLTGVDLYGPGVFFRLHVLAETLLPATLVHLALACPARPRWALRQVDALVYAVAAMIALIYQLFLYEPRAYFVIHNLCQGLVVVPIFVLAGRLALAAGRADTVQESRALVTHLAGVVVGLVAPALVFGLSSLASGDIPVSVAGWLNFVYPSAVVASMRLRSGFVLAIGDPSPA